ncbi:hypothetical protein [Paenibacillus sp. NEAU-GSW1]|uniref:hypothetical protein n=1 Tax=Paenibacillus sp. NEAU-GSW1 TaxID=2682486 RepID=UPI0012E1BDF4|nr:hypothetical protein [Paenibacillus sp. NEAU-GSW1]MUT64894.1 hypothetical protein [Paenibacillus sp. NEAU-GSW1]
MKKLILMLVAVFVMAGCAANESKEGISAPAPTSSTKSPEPESAKKMTEQDIALRLNEVRTKFANEFALDEALLAEPLEYDVTNDGEAEIVLFTKKQFNDGLENYCIAVYSLQDGIQLFAGQYEASDEVYVTPIANPAYRNSLAVIKLYAGASSTNYTAEVLAYKGDTLTAVASVSAEVGEPYLENIIIDVDADNFQEFKGYGYDLGPGSDRLSRADGVMEELVFKWSDSTSSYEAAAIGTDGLLDDERNSIGEITKDKAIQIVQVAQKLQYDWMSPIETEEGVKELMRPFFSNNFIYEFMQDGALFSEEYNGYLQKYTETGDMSWLMPTYNDDAELEKSADGIHAYLKQSIEQQSEDGSYYVQASTSLVKTKYGWMIDKIEYLE